MTAFSQADVQVAPSTSVQFCVFVAVYLYVPIIQTLTNVRSSVCSFPTSECLELSLEFLERKCGTKILGLSSSSYVFIFVFLHLCGFTSSRTLLSRVSPSSCVYPLCILQYVYFTSCVREALPKSFSTSVYHPTTPSQHCHSQHQIQRSTRSLCNTLQAL